MCKNTKKKRNKYNSVAVNALIKKYSLSGYYIRQQCLRGDRQNLTADKIRSDYKVLDKEINQFINKQ